MVARYSRRPPDFVLKGAAAAIFAAILQADPSTTQPGPISVSGGATVVGQATDDDRVRSEVVASLDVFVDVHFGAGRLRAYVEGNTTGFSDGVSRLVGGANTDAGTALDSRGHGRLQLSELRLVWPVAGRVFGHVGLLDVTGFLDVSRIANDENLFFLAVPFVNNPTIEFPDYAVGGALDGPLAQGGPWRLGATITSSHGLADNPGRSYGEVLDVTASEKGLFAGAALKWENGRRRVSVGGWLRTERHDALDGSDRRLRKRGAFAVAGWNRASHALSARVGIADGDVSPVSGFLGLTYLWTLDESAAGLALGRSFASKQQAILDHRTQLEAFLRRRFVRTIFVTLSVQRIENPDLDGSGAVVGPRLWIGGLRLSSQF